MVSSVCPLDYQGVNLQTTNAHVFPGHAPQKSLYCCTVSIMAHLHDDDDLGDLSEIIGEDYRGGGDFDDGDPNIKPRVSQPPKQVLESTVVYRTDFLTLRLVTVSISVTTLYCMPFRSLNLE